MDTCWTLSRFVTEVSDARLFVRDIGVTDEEEQ